MAEFSDVKVAAPGPANPDSVPDPVVSVIVPAHQAAAYLAECLASITNQTRPPDEVVVVDDGSTDDTAAIATAMQAACSEGAGAAPLQIRVISTPHLGAASARNTGVGAAMGNIVAFCDADDVWLPHKLEAQLGAIEDPDAKVAVFCGATEFLSPEVAPADYTGRPPTPVIPQARFSSTLVATTSALGAVGPFSGGVGAADWLPWCVALADTIDDIRFVDTIGTRRRLHLTNSSAARHRDRTAWLAALRRHASIQTGNPTTDDWGSGS